MRPLALITAALMTGALVLAGCGGGAATPPHRPGRPTSPSAAPAGPSAAPAGPSAAIGVRSFATVAGCLHSHAIPTTPYRPPAGVAVKASASAPRVLLAMPWDAIAVSVYSAPVAGRSSITVEDAGAVLAFGNVALGLDQLPRPPPATMRTIEACAFGR